MEGLLTNALSNGTIPAPPPRLGVQNPLPKTSIAIIAGTGEAVDFKFGQYIHRVHPNKSPLKFLGAWAYPGTAQIFCVPRIISATGKATNFKFCICIHRIDWNKSPLYVSGKVAMGILRDSRIFSGHPYIGHIVRSSLWYFSFLFIVNLWCCFKMIHDSRSYTENDYFQTDCARHYDVHFVHHISEFHEMTWHDFIILAYLLLLFALGCLIHLFRY